MKRIYLLFLGIALGFVVLQATGAVTASGWRHAFQHLILGRSGEVRGQVNFCGPQGNSGVLVHLPGYQFQVKTDATGSFVMRYVPRGNYVLQIEVPGQAPLTEDVHVDRAKVTDLGLVEVCPDNDNDSFAIDVDCNDNNPAIHPGAVEECDSVDNNCDGDVDEGCVTCTDGDGDGFPAQDGCPELRDCDDSDGTVFPGAGETCNGKDDNCDGAVDEGFDVDGDGYTTCGGDCNDNDPAINPEATELCDEIDNDCDSDVDENFDRDSDGFTTCGGDCNDDVSDIFPGAADLCDGLDNDCDPATPDGSAEIGFGQLCDGPDSDFCNEGTLACNGTSLACTDNSDDNFEICNGIDDNCDGNTDENFDFLSDPSNCGSCGNSCAPISECGPTGACSGGQCVIAPAGTPCSGGSCDGNGTCVTAVCGNGTVELPEQCDDGNSVGGDGCSVFCTVEPPSCGNGTVDPGEQCDDGNLSNGDGCQSDCTSAPWCDPRSPAAVCGPNAQCQPQAGSDSDRVPTCLPTTGTGVQAEACVPGECAPGYLCVAGDPVFGSALCLQWCRVGLDSCGGTASCVASGFFVGATEWGLCTPESP